MTWHIDPAHSEIEFSVRHMMISRARGRFTRFSGTIEGDEQNPTAAKGHGEIDAASIDTGNADRDTHLRSADFLNVDQYPTITFTSTKIERRDANHGLVHGELTMHSITRPVTLEVEYAAWRRAPGAR
ncbi:MAG TPA: YceI family protein [Roseiflexaceae bacterium]|nr:YceI family protein [Roseiflexaceae bacterium]